MNARPQPLVALAALFGLTAAVPAQFDPTASEPLWPMRGHLVMCGSDAVPPRAIETFVELLGENKRVVAIGTDRALEDRLREAAGNLTRIERDTRETVAALAGSSGAWIAGDDPGGVLDRWRDTDVHTALRDLIERGGVIGCSGAAVNAVSARAIVAGERHARLRDGLDLLPGTILETGFGSAGRRDRLLSAIGSHRELVGLGIEPGAALVLQRRWFSTVGAGASYAFVAASTDRPLRVDRIPAINTPTGSPRGRGARGPRGRGQRAGAGQRGQRRPRARRSGDLIILHRAAVARTRPRFPADPAPKPNVANGTLVIVGGGGSPPGMWEKFVELAGGPDAPLVYVPCSEEETIDTEPRTCEVMRRAGAKDVTWIHTKDRVAANTDEKILGPLRRARGIWFGGGRQWNLVDSYQNTTAHRLMHEVLDRGGVIGGSSAGASIQGDYMARGNSLGNLDIMAEGYETGLGFLVGVAIDQHFTQRGRLPNMTSLANTYPQLLGIGLDEACSIIVQGSIAEVYAREGRRAHFYDRNVPVFPDRPDYFRLDSGETFDLVARRPLDDQGRPVPVLADLVGTWSLTDADADSEAARTLRIRLNRTGQLEVGDNAVEIRDVKLDDVEVHIEFADGPVGGFDGTLVHGKLEGTVTARNGAGSARVTGERTSENPEPPRRRRGR